jgi:hypothetical protein
MKVHYLPLALAAGLVMHLTAPANATSAALRSPQVAQTYADNSILWHQLRWLPGSRQLVATITFSNIEYISREEPRHDETFNFALPGVTFDAGSGTFYMGGTPVAKVQTQLIGKGIELLPTARVLVNNHSGRVTVRLLANQPPSDGELWVER